MRSRLTGLSGAACSDDSTSAIAVLSSSSARIPTFHKVSLKKNRKENASSFTKFLREIDRVWDVLGSSVSP